MTLDDGAADGAPDSHPATFRRVERFEEIYLTFSIEVDHRVFHDEAGSIVCFSVGLDDQMPWTIVDAAHRIRGVAHEVQNDLLKLDAIPRDQQRLDAKIRPQNHTAALKVTGDER